tara:strand:- start:3805 stop:4608 length:804 start_codon:yes stop_codon:yes gene_type:complete
MKRFARMLVTAGIASSLIISTVQAGAVVYDPTNWVQNSISAIQSVQQTLHAATQVAQQITQIQNEINMLINQGKMLAQLPTSLQSDIINSIRQLETLIANTRGIIMDYNGLQTQFDDLYRTDDYSGWSGADYMNSVDRLSAETIDAANNAMEAQGLIADLDQDRVALNSLLAASKSAQGQLGALQAANEISGIMTSNLMRLEVIMSESARAESTQIAALEKVKQDSRARFLMGLEALRRLGEGAPTFTPVNDDKFLNPIGTKRGSRN